MDMADAESDPILIVGAGVFGLSTALSLLHRDRNRSSRSRSHNPPPSSSSSSSPLSKSKSDAKNQNENPPPHIHILDASPQLPNPSGSSVDASRIIRADYASAQYASLAHEAQRYWRDQSPHGWGGQGRYSETGFVLIADDDVEGRGRRYVQSALRNVQGLADAEGLDGGDGGGKKEEVKDLGDVKAIRQATGYNTMAAGSGRGVTGYVNWSSGWADAEACVEFALEKLRREDKEGKIVIDGGKMVRRLLFTNDHSTTDSDSGDGGGEAAKPKCTGVELEGGQVLRASLVILATGAWTPTLIDLRGRAIATGQTLAYMDISETEQKSLQSRPALMNMSRGMFIIPPRRQELKIGRHAFGYRNPKTIHCPSLVQRSDAERRHAGNVVTSEIGDMFEISVPETSISIPHEGEQACRDMLQEVLPEMADRSFSRTRICWYCDTPSGNFLIDYHPDCSNLFLATGGSGHGFKFFPVIGEKIVDAIEGCLEPGLRQLWRWEEEALDGFQTTEDASRGGKKGMILYEEVSRVY